MQKSKPKQFTMKKIVIASMALLLSAQYAKSQGCVAIRSTGAVCTRQEANVQSGGWQLNTSYRFFKSYKHFVGTDEQKEREERGTDVRNWQHTLNLTLVRQFNSRWSMALDVPIIYNDRSSMYEHYGNASTSPNARRHTRAFGLGDVRVSGAAWLLDPAIIKKGNVQFGLGIKLPTGDYRVQDFFWKNDSTQLLGPVDQSIQLGDGGTGFTAEVNAYFNFTPAFGIYANAFYLLNPREQNGVSTARGGTPNATALKYGTSTMSVPDQYMARAGANVSFGPATVSGGVRMECIPSEDLIGGSSGFRRPGYVISAEPAVSVRMKNVTAFAAVPIALSRNRTQSYSDKLRTRDSGEKVQGDAAFADYSINVGLVFKIK
jgi:hypothetical protein